VLGVTEDGSRQVGYTFRLIEVRRSEVRSQHRGLSPVFAVANQFAAMQPFPRLVSSNISPIRVKQPFDPLNPEARLARALVDLDPRYALAQ
jgi:hypothetical protein